MVHQKATQQASWSYHAKEGFYVDPSPNHYQCMRCYIPSTRAEVDADTIHFIPSKIPIPATSTKDYLNQAAGDILAILQNPPPTLAFLDASNATTNTITKITTLLQQATTKAAPILPPSTSSASAPNQINNNS
jgi:hypothetical protein